METTAPSCGFVYFSATYIPEGQKRPVTPYNINSVAVNPEQIRQGMPEPSDFRRLLEEGETRACRRSHESHLETNARHRSEISGESGLL